MGITRNELVMDAERVDRQRSQCVEHWEAVIEEMREKYTMIFQMGYGALDSDVANLIWRIQEFDSRRR